MQKENKKKNIAKGRNVKDGQFQCLYTPIRDIVS